MTEAVGGLCGAPHTVQRAASTGVSLPQCGQVIPRSPEMPPRLLLRDGQLSRIPFRNGSVQTRDWYSPVSVLTRTLSPSLTNGGTWMTRPVSSVAGLIWLLAVAPLIPGAVVLTIRSTVGGSSMPTGSTS